MNDYVEEAKELRRNCCHAATCGDCNDDANKACFDLCGWDSKSLAEVDVNVIADYLRRCNHEV